MMDIFLEYLVQKKSSSDAMKKALLKVACAAVLLISFYLCFFVFIQFLWLVPMIWGAAIYGTWFFLKNFSVEYEYIFTNGQLDIDIILGRSRRKNMVSLICRNIEYMAPLTSENTSSRKVYDAIYDERRRGKYYIDFSQNGEACRLLFQPPEKILMNMKKYNPRNINL